MHIANVLKEMELNRDSVVKEFLTTAADGTVGKRQVFIRK